MVDAYMEDDSEYSRHDKRNHHVTFGDVEFIRFPLILGDNPVCEGAPLSLDWTPTDKAAFQIDLYEFTRGPRRTKHEMHMSIRERTSHLLCLGYSLSEIVDVEETNAKIRKERLQSFQRKKYDGFYVVLESAVEKLKGGKRGVVDSTRRPKTDHATSA